MATACRSIARRRSSCATMSTSTAVSWRGGWASSGSNSSSSRTTPSARSNEANEYSPTRRRCQHLFPDRGRPRRRIYGRTRETIGRSVGMVRLWWPIALKTVAPAIASPGISMAIAVSCRSMATPPITVLHGPSAEMTVLFWRDLGAQSASVLRAARKRQLQGGNGDNRKDGRALVDRGKGAWPKP